jgi:hypothetical protein
LTPFRVSSSEISEGFIISKKLVIDSLPHFPHQISSLYIMFGPLLPQPTSVGYHDTSKKTNHMFLAMHSEPFSPLVVSRRRPLKRGNYNAPDVTPVSRNVKLSKPSANQALHLDRQKRRDFCKAKIRSPFACQ